MILGAHILVAFSFGSARVTKLPEYPKTPQPHPYAISGNGKVVIGQFAPGNAFIWRGAETSRFKPNPDQKVLDHYAQATNEDGSMIVGKAGSAYRYSKTLGFRYLGKLAGDSDSFAYDISGDGSVIVGYSQGLVSTRSFVWRPTSGMAEIPAPEPQASSIALAVSKNGKVAVGISTTNGLVRAYRTDFRISELLPIGKMHIDSAANDVSGDGEIVVGSVSGEDGSSAVCWKTQQVYFLPNLGKKTAAAKVITANGDYIGGFCGDDAVIWHEGKVAKVEALVNAPGWKFESVNGIAQSGGKVFITGWGNFGGKDVGYYAVMTE